MSESTDATGADFAASFLKSMEQRKSAVPSQQLLAHWFDLALEEGRRTRPPAAGWVTLTAISDEYGHFAVRPEDIVVVAERPDATEILVDGHWLSVCEEYDDVVRAAGLG